MSLLVINAGQVLSEIFWLPWYQPRDNAYFEQLQTLSTSYTLFQRLDFQFVQISNII